MIDMELLPALPPTLSMNRSIPSLYSLPQMLKGPGIEGMMPTLTSSAPAPAVQATTAASTAAETFQAVVFIVFSPLLFRAFARSPFALLTRGPTAVLGDQLPRQIG